MCPPPPPPSPLQTAAASRSARESGDSRGGSELRPSLQLSQDQETESDTGTSFAVGAQTGNCAAASCSVGNSVQSQLKWGAVAMC